MTCKKVKSESYIQTSNKGSESQKKERNIRKRSKKVSLGKFGEIKV